MEILKDEGIKFKKSIENVKYLPQNNIEEYDSIQYDPIRNEREFHEGLCYGVNLFDGIDGRRRGYFNCKGEAVISSKYDYAGDFYEGLAKVNLNDKWGYINDSGEKVISCIYDYVGDFHEGLAWVKSNGKCSYINQQGKKAISHKYDAASDFHEGLAAVKLNGMWGYINQQGEEVIPYKYDDANDFHEGLASITKWSRETGSQSGFINKKGEEVIPCIYDYVGDFHEGLVDVASDGEWGYINQQGEEVIPSKYSDVSIFNEGLAVASLYDREYNETRQFYVNTAGEEVFPSSNGFVRLNSKRDFGISKEISKSLSCECDFVSQFHNGYAVIGRNGKHELIDKNGMVVYSSRVIQYLGEDMYLIFVYDKNQEFLYRTLVSLEEILTSVQEKWEKISNDDFNKMNAEELKEASRKISTSYDVKRYFDLIVDGEVFSFDTKEEREEYEQKLLETSKDEKHYTKK